ncbi:MAG: FKBP-type peptidyl-prolyl cis-trans isomerase [Oculatellaceae cyanobacterium Prado106]|jgi:hypothetical protein|nr:FKBP-type peptidyl-prolyl cis-trans isomerase [Oculatellaceae cyanobacterium Prado106]
MARDPGSTFDTARNFRLRETNRTLRQSLASDDRIDLWRINPQVRSSFNLRLQGLARGANADITLLDFNGRAIANAKRRGNKPERLSAIPLEPGTYFVRVAIKRGSSDSRYALTLSAAPLADQLGNSFDAPTPLRSATGTLTDFVGNSDPNDIIGFGTLTAGTLQVSLTNLSGDANLEILDGNRNPIAISSNPGTANETLNQRLINLPGSNYFIRISPAPGQDANYTLNYSYIADARTQSSTGLESIDLAPGSGPTPTPGQFVTVQYTGVLNNGFKFDSSLDRNRPFTFQIGQNPPRVIAGWEEGLSTMRAGGRRQLIIPASLGYGSRAVGNIPPNSTLIFDVELLSISNTPPSS